MLTSTSSTPPYLRQINQRRVIESVLRLRRASRAQISRVSGISSPTVSRIVDDLLRTGVLMEPHPRDAKTDSASRVITTASVGRPSAPLELDSRRPRFLAIQIGVHETRLTRTPIALRETDEWETSFKTPHKAADWFQQLSSRLGKLRVRDLRAAVVSVPGVVDEASGRVLLSPNLKWLESADLKALMAQALPPDMQVIFIQEIRALALGHLAASPEQSDFFLIDVGTGFGGASVVKGSLLASSLPLNGELGHTPVLGNARVCGCGSIGCVETLLSRRGLMMSALENDGIHEWPCLVERVRDAGIPAWMKRSLDTAAVNVAAALNVLGLRKVVLTGCLAELPATVTQYLSAAVRADTMWARFGEVEIDVAPRRRLAGMVHTAIARTLLAPHGH